MSKAAVLTEAEKELVSSIKIEIMRPICNYDDEKLLGLIKKAYGHKVGHWVDNHCDCCGKVAAFHVGRCGGSAYTEMYYSNYCPNCGAKMVEPPEGEDKE